MTTTVLASPVVRAPLVYRLNVPAIWRYLLTQPASFWFFNLFLFIEYVRPQQVWPVIDVLPWGLSSLLLTTAALILEGRMPALRTPAGGLLAAFTVVLVLSSVTAVDPSASYAGWQLYFSWVLVFLLMTNIVTTEKRFFIVMLAFLLYCFKMSQHGFRTWLGNGFGFSDWGATGGPGWFHNSGEFGIQMCIFLPLSVEFILALRNGWNRWVRWGSYLLPVTAVASMVASSSRGALVGGAAVALWWVARSKQRLRAMMAIALLGIATWVVVPAEQKARFATSGEDETSISRIDRWEDGIAIANQYPVLGIGYDNWLTYYGPLSHNVFIQAWAELGYVGLLAFLAMIAGTFIVNAHTRRLVRNADLPTPFIRHMAYGLDGALVGFLTSGFFVTVLYYPFFWINLAMTAALHVTAHNAVRASRSRRAAGMQAATSAAVVPGFVRTR